ncbi:hypothetical protein QVD17_18422 [Tagetes erecta]|uniref:Bet v I/Major latex protein domain-containing protein n=1 Tax=Tagetes erecta TaxID=13708 RepID=A0AAD8KHI4_TARER|nr:hypothetical protein QVD17_18422 [Tagetes erecta]
MFCVLGPLASSGTMEVLSISVVCVSLIVSISKSVAQLCGPCSCQLLIAIYLRVKSQLLTWETTDQEPKEMALSGKRVAQVEIKSNGDVFHKLWKSNPHQVPSLTPTTIQNCQTVDGEVGTVGSVLLWNYFHDGKDCVGKTLLKDINNSKKLLTFEVIGGDLLEQYTTFFIHIQVDKHGSNNLVTWTVEYEKLNPNVPDPDTLMDFYTKVAKDIETHHLHN